MSKRPRPNQQQGGSPPTPVVHYGPPRGGQGMAVATLVGVMAVLMVSFSNWREIDGIEESLEGRLVQIENRIAQVADKVDKLPAQAAQPARRGGLDPNKVYKIKTAGAPVKGPAKAAVTIAEFSDFQ